MKRAYTLYMAQREHDNFLDCVTDSGREQLSSGVASTHAPTGFPGPAVLYLFKGNRQPPRWLSETARNFDGVPTIFSQSAAALILFNQSGRTFAVTYGYGWIYLKDSILEPDFGLRVAVNMLDQSKLKNLEKANLGVAVRNFSQAAFQGRLQDLGFDQALDVVRRIAGKSDETELGDRANGSKSLKVTVEKNMDELPRVATTARAYFERTGYKDTEFRVIDFLRPLGGGPVVERLNNILVDNIKSGGADFEISAPQLLDDDYDFFQIKGPGRGAQFPFMNMETYTNTLGKELDALTIESLTQHRITVLSDTSSHSLGNWSVYRCIVGSCELDGTQYAINEGSWYSVEDAFKVGAESVYQDRILPIDPSLKTFSKKYKGKSGKKVQIQREEEYLKQVAGDSNLVLMDQKFVRLAGVTRGRGVEVCDLLDIDGKRLIHVKKGSANSSVLSHLFRQGFASAQMLKMSAEFRTNVRDEIAKFDKKSAEAFEEAIGDGTGWTVEYRIADSVRASGNHDIPFFSKLSFKDAAEKGETMGYSFRLGYIDLAPITPPAS